MNSQARISLCRGATLGDILSILGLVTMLLLLGAAGCSFLAGGASVKAEKTSASAPAATATAE